MKQHTVHGVEHLFCEHTQQHTVSKLVRRAQKEVFVSKQKRKMSQSYRALISKAAQASVFTRLAGKIPAHQ